MERYTNKRKAARKTCLSTPKQTRHIVESWLLENPNSDYFELKHNILRSLSQYLYGSNVMRNGELIDAPRKIGQADVKRLNNFGTYDIYSIR